jgi:DNA-binding protein H-NS
MSDLLQRANDLRAQAAVLEAQAAEQLQAARTGVLTQLKATIAEHGFTAADLGLKTGKGAATASKTGRSHPSAGKKVPAKYKDHNNNEWTGRGVKPRWLVDALASGQTLESFAV